MTEHLTDDVIAAGGAPDPQPGSTAEVDGRQDRAGKGRASRVPWSRTTRRLVGTVALAPVALVAGAMTGCTPAPGGTASVGPESYGGRLQFDAVNGRSNSITVSVGDQGTLGRPTSLLLRDSRNPVTPGSGCTRVDANTVRCSAGTIFGFGDQLIRLGDGNDSYASSVAVASTVHAGAGNDTVSAGASTNEIDAGSGNDTVIGGAAQDVVHVGAGNDTVNSGAGDDVVYEDSDALDVDSFSGGTGRDVIDYFGVLHGVTISLNDIVDDGRPGEGDNVKSDVEDIRGGGFADTLTGDGDANVIWPIDISRIDEVEAPGAGIVVNGGGGNDDIYGSASATSGDRLSGGTGNDAIAAWAGDDVLNGGAGDDRLLGLDGVDALDGGSESDYCDVGPAYQTDDVPGGTAVNCETGPGAN